MEGWGVGGSSRTEPGATVLARQVVVEEESLAQMTSHPVSLLFTDPHQVTGRLNQTCSQSLHTLIVMFGE